MQPSGSWCQRVGTCVHQFHADKLGALPFRPPTRTPIRATAPFGPCPLHQPPSSQSGFQAMSGSATHYLGSVQAPNGKTFSTPAAFHIPPLTLFKDARQGALCQPSLDLVLDSAQGISKAYSHGLVRTYPALGWDQRFCGCRTKDARMKVPWGGQKNISRSASFVSFVRVSGGG